MSVGELVLGYVEVLLSAPPVIGALVWYLMRSHPDEIREFLKKISNVKVFGSELITQQPPERSLPPVQSEKLSLREDAKLNEWSRRELEDARTRAIQWEFAYLNQYLVPKSVGVLKWIGEVPSRYLPSFHHFWSTLIPTGQERETILAALSTHSLIEQNGSTITITEKGRGFLDWRGVRNHALTA